MPKTFRIFTRKLLRLSLFLVKLQPFRTIIKTNHLHTQLRIYFSLGKISSAFCILCSSKKYKYCIKQKPKRIQQKLNSAKL